MAMKRRSNGSLHRVLACSAGCPGFDSRLRRLVASVLPMLYAEDVGGPGQAPTDASDAEYSVKQLLQNSQSTYFRI